MSRLPKIQVTGRISLDYPNGPILEQITQKSAGVAVSMPIFTGTRLVREAEEQRQHAATFEAQRNAARSDLARDWSKATARYRLLQAQAELNRQAAAEARETSDLVYASYRGGQARFIEVETANLHALEALVQEARTKADMLTQLAIMHSLSKEEN
jgi:outer membrane protein TolC